MRVSLYCLAFCFEFEQSQNTQNKSSEKHFCSRKKNYLQLIFNLKLALTRFRTTWPYLQQVKMTRVRDAIENQHLVTGQIQTTRHLDKL